MMTTLEELHEKYAADSAIWHERLQKAYEQNPLDYDICRDLAFSHLSRGLAFGFAEQGPEGERWHFLPHYQLQARSTTDDVPRFLLWSVEDIRPFHEAPLKTEKGERSIEASVREKELQTAENIFAELHNREQMRPHGLLGRGLCRLARALNQLSNGNKKPMELLQGAAADFDQARLIEEQASPAYLYAALAHFLLRDLEGGIKQITNEREWQEFLKDQARKRQAFYRLEHFIDQWLEIIICPPETRGTQDKEADIGGNGKKGDNCDSLKKKVQEYRKCKEECQFGFYFDGADVERILPNPYRVTAFLEGVVSLMPFTRAFLQDRINADNGKKDGIESLENGEDIRQMIARRTETLVGEVEKCLGYDQHEGRSG